MECCYKHWPVRVWHDRESHIVRIEVCCWYDTNFAVIFWRYNGALRGHLSGIVTGDPICALQESCTKQIDQLHRWACQLYVLHALKIQNLICRCEEGCHPCTCHSFGFAHPRCCLNDSCRKEVVPHTGTGNWEISKWASVSKWRSSASSSTTVPFTIGCMCCPQGRHNFTASEALLHKANCAQEHRCTSMVQNYRLV